VMCHFLKHYRATLSQWVMHQSLVLLMLHVTFIDGCIHITWINTR